MIIMKDDSINRQAAIDAVSNWLYDRDDKRTVDQLLSALPSAQPEDCDTCKHGYFGDGKCDNCRVRFPSHYERRADEGN